MRYYQEYLVKRKTLFDIAKDLNISIKTLRKRFDQVVIKNQDPNQHHHALPGVKKLINLVFDATYFGREYGYFCFSDGKKIIYYKEIKSEGIAALRECLMHLEDDLGYSFNSFVLDGKRGFINNLKKLYKGRPIQMCHFHQKAIVRRYITNNPKSDCGKELRALMHDLSKIEPQEFIDRFFALREKYHLFLIQRNESNKGFRHSAVRSAFASIKYNLEYLFTYKEHTNLNIPNTTNSLEGKFSHLKEKIKIHRGLSKNRKKKAVSFLLQNWKEK